MKKIIISFIAGLSMLSAQSQVLESDKAKLTNIEIVTGAGDYKVTDMNWVGTDQILTQSKKINPISFTIIGPNINLGLYNQKDQTGIKMMLKAGKNEVYQQVISNKNGSFVLKSTYDGGTTTNSLSFQKLNLTDLTESGSPTSMYSVSELNKNIGGVVGFFKNALSPDNSKLVLNYVSVAENLDNLGYANAAKAETHENEKIQIAVFNDEMNLIWKNSFDTPYNSKYADLEKIAVDNSGNAYVLCRVYNNEKRWEQKDGKLNYQYSIFGFFENGEVVKEFKIDHENHLLGNMNLVIDKKQDLVCVGISCEEITEKKKLYEQKSLNSGLSSTQDPVIFGYQSIMSGQLLVKINVSSQSKTLNKIVPLKDDVYNADANVRKLEDIKAISNVTVENIFFDDQNNMILSARSVAPRSGAAINNEKDAALYLFNFSASGDYKTTQIIPSDIVTSGYAFVETPSSLKVMHVVHPKYRPKFSDLAQGTNDQFVEERVYSFAQSEIKFGEQGYKTEELIEIKSSNKVISSSFYTKTKILDEKFIFFRGTISDFMKNKLVLTEQPSKNFTRLTCVELK